mmetsp:Transcript_27497/g.58454  ORF Transcript_27497/g.58454 Transcript_27497/m.58454 type:complete len:257 (+) Transcript_27497:449-1219(+)
MSWGHKVDEGIANGGSSAEVHGEVQEIVLLLESRRIQKLGQILTEVPFGDVSQHDRGAQLWCDLLARCGGPHGGRGGAGGTAAVAAAAMEVAAVDVVAVEVVAASTTGGDGSAAAGGGDSATRIRVSIAGRRASVVGSQSEGVVASGIRQTMRARGWTIEVLHVGVGWHGSLRPGAQGGRWQAAHVARRWHGVGVRWRELSRRRHGGVAGCDWRVHHRGWHLPCTRVTITSTTTSIARWRGWVVSGSVDGLVREGS